MPELPEVETMRRGILPIVGSRIEDFRPAKCAKRPITIDPRPPAFRRRVVGRSIVGVERIGKRVVVRLDSRDGIVLEPRMTGLVLLAAPPTAEHLRVRIASSGRRNRELLFWDRRGLGSVRLLTADELDQRYGLDKLGPDALALTCETLVAGSAQVGAKSRWRCSTSAHWQAWAICMPAKSCIWLASIPSSAAICCAPSNGKESTPRSSKCSLRQFCTKARRCPTARTAMRSTAKADINNTIAFTTAPASCVPAASAPDPEDRASPAVDVLLRRCQPRKR